MCVFTLNKEAERFQACHLIHPTSSCVPKPLKKDSSTCQCHIPALYIPWVPPHHTLWDSTVSNPLFISFDAPPSTCDPTQSKIGSISLDRCAHLTIILLCGPSASPSPNPNGFLKITSSDHSCPCELQPTFPGKHWAQAMMSPRPFHLLLTHPQTRLRTRPKNTVNW